MIPVGSLDEAIEVGNSVEYGLSASIYTQDINKAFTAMRDMYTGIFYVNAPTIGAETHLPFGGTKNTGNGHREACVQALDVFSRVEVDLHRLQRPPAAGPDRHRGRRVAATERVGGRQRQPLNALVAARGSHDASVAVRGYRYPSASNGR